MASLPEQTDRVILWITRALGALGAACIAAMAVLTVLAVVMRYAVGAPFAFTEDLAGLMLVSAVFLACAAVFFRDARADLNLTMMLNLKSEVARIPLAPFVAMMSIGVALAALVAAWQMLRPPPEGMAGPDLPEKGFEP